MSRVHPLGLWARTLLGVAVALPACTAANPQFLRGVSDGETEAGASQHLDARPADGPAPPEGPAPPDGPASPDGPDPEVRQADLETGADRPPAPNGIDLRTGLLGYWKFEDADSSPMARDSSGNGYDGALENLDLRAARVAGRFGGGLRITVNDAAGGVRVDHRGALDNLRAYTLAVWTFRPEARPTTYNSLISRQYASGDEEIFNLMFARDHLRIYRSINTNGMRGNADAVATAPLNRWVHAAATWNGQIIRLYQDGVEVGDLDQAFALTPTSTPLYLGTNINANGQRESFVGTIDEVAVYSVALSPAAIAALAAGAAPIP